LEIYKINYDKVLAGYFDWLGLVEEKDCFLELLLRLGVKADQELALLYGV